MTVRLRAMDSIFSEGLAHQKAGRLDEAEACYRRIMDWQPGRTLGNLGVILRITGRLDEAEAVQRQALLATPGHPGLQHTLGMTLLQLGRYAEGWALYESRHQFLPRPTAPFPEWQGESLAGKRILVLGEQGLGDQILLSRFIPLLAQQAAEVRLAVARPLVRLFEELPAHVYNAQSFENEQVDLWASIGSVPRWLGAGPDDAPAPTLRASAPVGATSGIGLMLQGGDRNPHPDRVPGPGIAKAIRGMGPFVELAPELSGARDFAATADLMTDLAHVLTVDTSVAHLAGSLGKPTWILASRPAIDWYIDWKTERSAWYPSAQVIRQRTPGDWAGVLADLAGVLDGARA
ncbi:MAG: tetratricopeptide repeat protein [Alphaproteobacteria bacterium]|nr:tetratricopeptide repeat protein [Alphaproteobacteria bacterium]MBU1514477.1 tetratricopeptide repeat protein [Alphaproteobacteria bacterium]MBU2096891.1 tetratricopeptide repeat protein [Alphaproteobacteria bacterium]MBU2153518.1 tetratricopeptide repeat protein [Alphaproteobacteria bacterium]MBU2305977.1 tetratricopeptide repeat protein [Alphaproteobacteria bacterium]